MKILLILLLGIFPFGQLLRLNFPGTGIVIHVNDLTVGIMVISWLLTKRQSVFSAMRKSPLLKPLAFWAGAIILSILVNANHYSIKQWLEAILYPLRFFAYAGLFFVVSSLGQDIRRGLGKWLMVAIVAVALVGLGQYLLLPDVSFLAADNWDDHYFRLISTFLDPGFTGAILVLGLLVLFDKLNKFGWAAGIIYTALALTYSRAAYLMYLVGFGVIAWYRKSFKIFLIALLVLLLTIPLLPKSLGEGTKLGRENSILARLNNWKQAISIWQQAPVFGVGFNAYRFATKATPESHAGAGSDSSLLLVLATTGMVGTMAYLGVLRSLWVVGKNNILFKAGFLAILVHSWFNNTLFYPFVMEWLWIALALSDYRPDRKR